MLKNSHTAGKSFGLYFWEYFFGLELSGMLGEISKNLTSLRELQLLNFCNYGSTWKLPNRHKRHTHIFSGGTGAIGRTEIEIVIYHFLLIQ